MLRNPSSTHPARPSPRTTSFRPRLEALEERLAPYSGMSPDFSTNGVTETTVPMESSLFAQQTLLAYGLPPSGYALYSMGGEPVGGYVATPFQPASNVSGGGFGGAASAAQLPGLNSGGGGNGGGGSSGSSMAQIEQLTATLYQMAAMQNPPEANALVLDEVFKAVDSYINDLGNSIGIHNPNLQGQTSAYQNAINQNPLEQSPTGQLLGNLVSNLTLNAISSGQAGGF
jgi:hypothetical protein